MDRVFDGPDAMGHFSRFLGRLTGEGEGIFIAATVAASEVIEKKVKAVFGDSSKLADLAESTQEEREAQGYAANEPLLRDGSLLRASVHIEHDALEGGVGSNEPIMLYSELGYMNHRTGKLVPPRPVFEIGLHDSLPELEALLDAAVGKALGDKPDSV